MEKTDFSLAHFKHRLNDLLVYLEQQGYKGYQYDVGYHNAIKHVLNMLDDYKNEKEY